MKINKNQIIAELDLVPFGSKGWMNSPSTPCPVCGKKDKFGILFAGDSGVTHCFYNCGENMSLYNYLKHIGRADLVEYEQEASINSKLPSLISEIEEECELPEIELPKGYRRIWYSRYLSERGFKPYMYDEFEVGETDHFLERRLHNYLIFVLKQKRRVVGWLARSKRSKEWHKHNLENHKLKGELLELRYRNSTGTDFEKILGGLDNITDQTEEVITVEGLFDYVNLSSMLNTHKSDRLKVVFTFGDKFSDYQIKLLRETNVKKVSLMYDYKTIQQSKRYSMELSKYFHVQVCYIDKKDVDPGNIDRDYLQIVLDSRTSAIEFYSSKISSEIKRL